MTVTELRAVTKQKFQVEIDGQPAFVLYKGELSRCHIEKGRGISPETYREITEEILPKRAKMRAMHLLEQGDRTRRGLEDKLLKSGYPPHAAEEALAYVESFHYIDDKRYALSYILSQKDKKGKTRIQMELRRKGVSQEDIDQAFSETEEDTDPRETIRADVILLEKDLTILERGLLSGRETFGNIMKYIKATASSNFGNMFSVLIASTFLPFLPMLPLQLLFLNLIYDVSCISLPWDRMDKEYLDEPKKWNASSIGEFMVYFGPTSSIFDITTYLLMYFVICPAVVGGSFHTLDSSQRVIFIALFHAGWFVESLWTQTLVLHALRTPKVPFIQSNATFAMFVITTLGIIVGSVLPFTSFGAELGLMPLPGNYWLWLFATVIAYLALVTAVKKIYIRRFQELL